MVSLGAENGAAGLEASTETRNRKKIEGWRVSVVENKQPPPPALLYKF